MSTHLILIVAALSCESVKSLIGMQSLKYYLRETLSIPRTAETVKTHSHSPQAKEAVYEESPDYVGGIPRFSRGIRQPFHVREFINL
jgi:hypothetical protein